MIAFPRRAHEIPLRGWLHRQARQRRSADRAFLASLLLFAAGLRIAAATGPLWLDEIWSLEIAGQARYAASVLTDFPTDNNHFLNTLYLRTVGPGRPPIVYRIPAIVCGVAAVLLTFQLGKRWGRSAAIYSATCTASSYVLIHYSSEARGYASTLSMCLLASLALLKHRETRSWNWAGLFWASCFLGLLSHPIFAHCVLAAACWAPIAYAANSPDWKAAARAAISLLGLPLLVCAVLFGTTWRRLELGGGPPFHWQDVLAQTGSLLLGGPSSGKLAIVVALLAVFVCGLSCWSLRNDAARSGLLLMLMLIVPFALAFSLRPPFLFPRYFLVSAIWFPLAVGIVLASIDRRGTRGRWLAAALLIALMSANVAPTAKLVKLGRGQYRQALEHILQHSHSPVVLVSSDHNFGVRKLIDFYRPQVSQSSRLQYCDGDRWPPHGPEWLILHRVPEDPRPQPPDQLRIDDHHFQLAAQFDTAVLSGWQWWCYRRTSERSPNRSAAATEHHTQNAADFAGYGSTADRSAPHGVNR